MVKIEPFEVEQWMDRLETTPGVLNIAETCAASVSVDELTGLNEDKNAPGPLDLSKKMTYGAIRGSENLRGNVSRLLSKHAQTPLPAENVVATQGAILANFLLLYTLVGPGDHVVCVFPTYQQLYAVPESLGAEVSLWKLKKERNYIPDVSELGGLVKSNTKVGGKSDCSDCSRGSLTRAGFYLGHHNQQSKQPNRGNHTKTCASVHSRFRQGEGHHRVLR